MSKFVERYEISYNHEGYTLLSDIKRGTKKVCKPYSNDNFTITTYDPIKKCNYEIRIY